MIDPHFAILGALLNIVGTLTYVKATLRGQTKPNRVTWAMWTLAPMIIFFAQLGEGVGMVAIITLSSALCPMMIFLSSFVNRSAYWQIEKIDLACGGLSLLALILWAITRTGDMAIIFSIISDGLASFPTLRKAFRAPETESSFAFVAAAGSAVIALLTIDTWTFAHYAFPVYLLGIGIALVAVIEVTPRLRPAAATKPVLDELRVPVDQV